MTEKKYLSEGWPYGYSIDGYEIMKPLDEIKSERDIDSLIFSYTSGALSKYFDYKGIQDIKEQRKAIEEEYKQKIKGLLSYMEKEYSSKAVEGRKQLEGLIPIYGIRIVAHMILHSELSYMYLDEIVKYLPSKEILEQDLKQYELLVSYASGYSSTIDYPFSLRLVMDLVEGKSLEEYPGQLTYVHQVCTDSGLKMYETPATFTKTEFIQSIKVKQRVLKK